jgi:type IV pilus assembly protein PilE
MNKTSSIASLRCTAKEPSALAHAARTNVARLQCASGFTLIELMVVVVIVAIFAAIAIPSYQGYARRAQASQTVQGMQQIAALLERNKARNLSYKGFDLSAAGVTAGRTYTFDLKDAADTTKSLMEPSALGRGWVLKATTSNNQNDNFLMTSSGIRCKNKTAANVSFTDCGTGSEPW